jgi:hypothetical protein
MGEIPEICGNQSLMRWRRMVVELIGILATLFVLLSFLMKEETRIRKINIIGATLFVIYGLLIKSISVWLLNSILCFIHYYYLKE